jgi:hypothetical protein
LKKDILKRKKIHCKAVLEIYKKAKKKKVLGDSLQNWMHQKPIRGSKYMKPIS